MTTEELMRALEIRAGNDEVSRAALGFIQKTIGVLNGHPDGKEIREAIENPVFFIKDKVKTIDSATRGVKPVKVIAYMIAHYGIDYIPVALKSVIDHVDEMIVIYTPHPSHGHQTTAVCPETKEQIWQATQIDSDKIRRYELSNIFYEGQQRDKAVEMCQKAGADLILVVDCDEVWPAEVLTKALEYAWTENKARNWLINFTHLWRSFNWVCRDQGWPVRIIDLRHPSGTVAYIPKEFGDIFHFGYCIKDSLMQYKREIHGHKYEFRPGWWENKWKPWPPVSDCHPTNAENFWTPEAIDRYKLPEVMHSHPFFNLERVE